MPGTAPLPCRGSEHLDRLVREVDVLAQRLRPRLALAATHAPDALEALRTEAREAALVATLFLDGATPTDAERVGTWADALEYSPGIGFDAPDEREAAEVARMQALEREGVRAAQASHDLLPAFATGITDASGLGGALIELHARLTAGLVAPERVGSLRRGPRVVHDSSIGRIIHFPTEPQHLGDAWEGLLRSLTAHGSPQAQATTAVRSGLLQLELLRHHPFDAANGRLARAAARSMLTADGLIDDLATPEAVLAEDPLGYLDGVAASVRRADATAWVERWVEAVAESLLRALVALDVLAPAGDDAGGIPGGVAPAADVIDLAELAALLGCSVAQARERASELVLAGTLRRVIGSGGLRLARR
jgi:Fic family protein